MNKLFNNLYIFEMANSHQGSVEHGINIIKAMGKVARKYNINAAVKLQYRDIDTFIHKDYVNRYDLKHIERFISTKLTRDDFNQLVEAIKSEGMLPMSTPFDEKGVDLCVDQGLEIIKVASCSAFDWPLLEKIAKTKKPVIISTGGKNISDIDKIFNFLTHRNVEFALMHCIAEYPAPEDRLQLDFIDKLKVRYKGIPIGYSGHEKPDENLVAQLAVAKGVNILERHVGLPTESIKLNAYSLNPQQVEEFVEATLLAKSMCTLKKDNDKYVSQDELDSLQSLTRGVYAKKEISKGEVLTLDNIYFAMPLFDSQMSANDYMEGMKASNDYKKDEKLIEQRKPTNVAIMRSVVHEAKGMLHEAGIALGNDFEVELSHHYGMEHFRKNGAIIISIINREYCKKLIIVLPGQENPTHYHVKKEETFQLLYGDLKVNIDGKEIVMKPGDIRTILRDEKHSFTSKTGAIFEEVSTTHIRNDSYYEDEKISSLDPLERKSILSNW